MFRKKYDYDLIVIGSGAGGSVGAHYARRLGKKVAIFEKGDMGGECPNWACIPTKALLKSAKVYDAVQNAHIFGINIKGVSVDYTHIHRRKNLVVSRTGATHGENVFRNNGIHVLKHKANFVSSHEIEAGGRIYTSDKFLIASGSSVSIPKIPGLNEAGFITFKQAVDLRSPPKSLFILGGGAVGCEFAQIFSTFGTKITIAARSSLLPKEDREVIDIVEALFKNQGIDVLNGIAVTKIEKKGNQKIVYYTHNGGLKSIEVEEILLATGKSPVLDFNLDKAGIRISESGIVVNHYLQTSAKNIFAAGDVVGPYLFTHSGYYQGSTAVHNAFSNKKIRVDYKAVPRCVFIDPEVASVGLSEESAKQKGIHIKKGLAAISILGRANTEEEFDGFVKIITDKKDIIIGASIVAPRAGEMIHELTLAIHLRIKAEVLAQMIHAYPTYSEAIKIACSNLE